MAAGGSYIDLVHVGYEGRYCHHYILILKDPLADMELMVMLTIC